MAPWDNSVPKNQVLYLFTTEEYWRLPDGIELECIDGKKAVKGKDTIDLDVRFGHIAYGVRNIWEHPQKNLFLMFKLAE